MMKGIAIYRSCIIKLLIILNICCVNGCGINPKKETSKFLSAIQSKNYQLLFNMDYYYQQKLIKIKNENPEPLWSKLSLQLFNEYKMNLSGTIKELISYPFTYQIIEIREKKDEIIFFNKQYLYNVFIKIIYKSIDLSPKNRDKYINNSIIKLVFDKKLGYYVKSNLISESCEYWDLLEALKAKADSLRFDECVGNDNTPFDKRYYTNKFVKSSKNYIRCELKLIIPQKRQGWLEFPIEFFWTNPDGKINKYKINGKIAPLSEVERFTFGYRSDWEPGVYQAVVKIFGKEVAKGSFEIVSDNI